jgi:hypothetical protein
MTQRYLKYNTVLHYSIASDKRVQYPSWTFTSEGLMRDPTCEGKIFAPHSSDCHKYYLCHFGVPTEQTCPGGLYWNKVNSEHNLNKLSLVTALEEIRQPFPNIN